MTGHNEADEKEMFKVDDGYDCEVYCECGWKGLGFGILASEARFNAELDHNQHRLDIVRS